MPMSLVCAIKIPLRKDLISVLHMQNISIVFMLFWLSCLEGCIVAWRGVLKNAFPLAYKVTKNVMRDYTDTTKCAFENDLALHQFFSLVAL